MSPTIPVHPDAGGNAVPTRRWYREAYVWLLIAFPAAAFFAGLTTLFIALHGADVEVPRIP